MTPRGDYRTSLEQHLARRARHAERSRSASASSAGGGNPLQAGIGLAETVIAQGLALAKTPIDLLRGSGGEEKVLKNAKDAGATEALEIATYTRSSASPAWSATTDSRSSPPRSVPTRAHARPRPPSSRS